MYGRGLNIEAVDILERGGSRRRTRSKIRNGAKAELNKGTMNQITNKNRAKARTTKTKVQKRRRVY